MPKVAVIFGSKSDLVYFEKVQGLFAELGVEYELQVLSAHRTPDELDRFAHALEEKGFEVVVTGAGHANHLSGSVAARTLLPVIGVPLPSSDLKGWDSLLSTVQMPPGIPVATMAIGEAGLTNAVILAAEMLQLKYPDVKRKLKEYRENLKRKALSPSSP